MKKCFLLTATAVLFAAATVWAAEGDMHPVEMEGQDCLYCHATDSVSENKSESPAYGEWTKSMHYVNSVTCVTCHGDESDFRPASSLDNCVSCHPGEAAVIKRATKSDAVVVCVNCHTAHEFIVKPEKKPVHTK